MERYLLPRVVLLVLAVAPVHVRPESESPPHYSFTQGNLKGLVVPLKLLGGGFEDLSIDGNLKPVMEDTQLFYADNSWGKLNLEFTYTPQYSIDVSSSSGTTGEIREASQAAASADGYDYCDGVCEDGQEGYDHFTMAFFSDNPDFDWAGLGVVGNGVTWTKMNTSAGIMEHEIGHNYGLPHQKTSKKLRNPDKTPTWEGFSRMASGGSVYVDTPSSRYVENGHFGICPKHWFGWLEDTDISSLHPDGPTDFCPSCVANGTFTVIAFDRPDMVPSELVNQDENKVFGLKIPMDDTTSMWIYYRSSYDDTSSGISVGYCEISVHSHLDVGANIATWTYDVRGDTSSMSDSTVEVGQTFVVHPFTESVATVPVQAFGSLAVVEVLEITDWKSSCRNTSCSDGEIVAATVSVHFIESDGEQPRARDHRLSCSQDSGSNTVEVDDGSTSTLIHVEHDFVGAGGNSPFNLTLCSDIDVDVFVHDVYPWSHFSFNSHPGVGAFATHTFYAVDCCAATGSALPIEGTRVVIVKQNEGEHLSIAELELIDSDGNNIASQATCYSSPVGGTWYNGDGEGFQTKMNDGDYETFSHSGEGSTDNEDVCVFPTPVTLSQVKVWPRQSWWSRSNNFTVSLYTHVGGTAVGGAPTPYGVHQTFNIENDGEWTDLHHTEDIAAIAETSIACPSASPPPAFETSMENGQAYVIATPSVEGTSTSSLSLDFTCSTTSCPVNSHWNESFATCSKCPSNQYVAPAGSDSEEDCAYCGDHWVRTSLYEHSCSRKLCDQLVIYHVDGSANDMDGVYNAQGTRNGKTNFVKHPEAQHYIYHTDGKWVIDDDDDATEYLAWVESDSEFPHVVGDEAVWSEHGRPHPDDIPDPVVMAIKITQMKNESLNQAELEVFAKSDPSVNIASEMTCYSWPTDGYWYNGDSETAVQTFLTDGDLETFSHSGEALAGVYDLCVFDEASSGHVLDHVVVHARGSWKGRSSDLTVEMFESYSEGDGGDVSAFQLESLVFSIHNADLSQSPEIKVTKTLPITHEPVVVRCPYKPAKGCEATMDSWCQGKYGSNFVAREDISGDWWVDKGWYCYNTTGLTSDHIHFSDAGVAVKTNVDGLSDLLTSDSCQADPLFIANSIGEPTVDCRVSSSGDPSCTVQLKDQNEDLISVESLGWMLKFSAVSSQGATPASTVSFDNDTSSYIITWESDGSSDWTFTGYMDTRAVGGEASSLVGEPNVPDNILDSTVPVTLTSDDAATVPDSDSANNDDGGEDGNTSNAVTLSAGERSSYTPLISMICLVVVVAVSLMQR